MLWRMIQIDLIQLKIEKDNSMIKYIKIIRKFDSSLSVGGIKQCIEKNDFVVGFDLEYYDFIEDINGINRKERFCDMIKELCQAGARISMYQKGELITTEFFHNWLETLDIIRQQVQDDIDRELET